MPRLSSGARKPWKYYLGLTHTLPRILPCSYRLPTAPRRTASDALSMVLITRNERVTSTNTRVETTVPNENGAAVLETWQYKVLDYLFSIPLFNQALFGVFRSQQVTKAEKMGIKWTAFLEDLNRNKEKLL